MGMNANYLKLLSAIVVAVFLAIPYWKGRYLHVQVKTAAPEVGAKREGIAMLELKNIYKTFNAGTVNEKTGPGRAEPDPQRRRLRHRHRRQRRRQVHHAQRRGRYLAGGRRATSCIGGMDVTHLPEHKRAKFIGRVFQDPMMGTAATMQIEENLALAARRGQSRGLRWGITKTERADYRELLRDLDLGLEDRLTSKVGLLSGGQRQALTLLMAALKRPKLLLLDEHTAALDPKTAAKVLELSDRIVEENHLTTMMVTHNMKDAIAHGNRLIMMYEGRIVIDVAGEEKKKLTVPQLLELFSKVSGSDEADDKMLLS